MGRPKYIRIKQQPENKLPFIFWFFQSIIVSECFLLVFRTCSCRKCAQHTPTLNGWPIYSFLRFFLLSERSCRHVPNFDSRLNKRYFRIARIFISACSFANLEYQDEYGNYITESLDEFLKPAFVDV